MKRLAFVVALLPFAVCGAGCPPTPTPQPDADSGATFYDATPPPPSFDACGRGETRLLALGCKDSRGRLIGGPNLHGLSWSQLCRNNADAGIDMRADCIASKNACPEVELCR